MVIVRTGQVWKEVFPYRTTKEPRVVVVTAVSNTLEKAYVQNTKTGKVFLWDIAYLNERFMPDADYFSF